MTESHQPEVPTADAARRAGMLDVREIPPRVRHPLIFDTFAALQPGES
jgi:uncharacterized protein (DUF2249 family)